jgi:hypothetical protein
VFPNCTAKPKGEKAMYVGDMLLDPKSEISQLTLRRPFDRVSRLRLPVFQPLPPLLK